MFVLRKKYKCGELESDKYTHPMLQLYLVIAEVTVTVASQLLTPVHGHLYLDIQIPIDV